MPNQFRYDIHFTNAAKGLALCMLLWHHLFYLHPEYGTLVQTSAILAKVCVAIFVMLSGFGFSESIRHKQFHLYEFYWNRLLSIYSNFWLIALLTIPVGVKLLGRSLAIAFGDHAWIKLGIQLTGLHRFFYEEQGYNGTWWYLSVIIPLILLFPMMYDALKRYGAVVLIGLLLLLVPPKSLVLVLNEWLLPFALGIYLSQKNGFPVISEKLHKIGLARFLVIGLAIALVAVFRQYSPILRGVRIDWLFAALWLVLWGEVIQLSAPLQKVFAWLGTHLFNIFLFHSFLFYYFWADWFYSWKHPVLIFLALLLVSLGVSIVLEFVKKGIRFSRLQHWLQRRALPILMRGCSCVS